MAIFMPTRMAEKMPIMAENLAVAQLRAENQVATAICSICGYTVKGPNPVVTCPVCRASADAGDARFTWTDDATYVSNKKPR